MNDKVKLLFIFGLPLFVMLAATFVYKTGIGIPKGTRNHGVLIDPPLNIMSISIRDEKGQPFDYKKAKHGWKILIPGKASCDKICEHVLWKTRQIHIALGRKGSQVTRYYLNTEAKNDAELAALIKKEYPYLQTLFTTPDQLNALFKNASKPIDALNKHLFFLVDPQGWVMMYYTPDHTGKDTLTDMKFLLNQTGDT